MAVIASPTLLPILLIVLKTPPARPCVCGGKMEVISKLEIVKRVSAQIGVRHVAKKAHVQYDNSSLTSAISRGATAPTAAVLRTRMWA